jgi:hypothetical protein
LFFFVFCLFVFLVCFLIFLVTLPAELFFWWFGFCFLFLAKIHFLCSTRGHNSRDLRSLSLGFLSPAVSAAWGLQESDIERYSVGPWRPSRNIPKTSTTSSNTPWKVKGNMFNYGLK